MAQLPPLDPLPDNIDDHIRRLLQAPPDPDIGPWLLELIRASGHMSTGDDMQWRLLSIVWLSLAYKPDEGWPYLQWLNMGEASISSHLSDMLIEALDAYDAHVTMTAWMAGNQDERLITFFKEFYPIPAYRKMPKVMGRLFAHPTRPETGLWLAQYCQGTAYNDSNFMRAWRLLAAAWYAAGFNPEKGLSYLHLLIDGAPTLSAADNTLLMNAAKEANGVAAMIQMIANCSDPAVKTMLKEFGHPDLHAAADSVLQGAPDYRRLLDLVDQAPADAAMFKQVLARFEEAGLDPKSTRVLDLACGPLAAQTLLLSSAGYKTIGVDLDIPPANLPLAGITQWFKRRKHVKAWQEATAEYYHALARQTELKLKWTNAGIKLADLTRLDQPPNSFEAVICINHLHHAPDVKGLLAEAARVLKPGGLFIANIRPYAGLGGAYQIDPQAPWAHLQDVTSPPPPYPVNRWREARFKDVLERYFELERWLPDNDREALSLLADDIRAQLADYSEEELTRKQIVVVAKKAG